jgi:ketosteroid isomerase-like protein
MACADPDVVRQYYEFVDAEAYGSVFELFADEVTYERPGQSNLSGMTEFKQFYLEDRPLEDGQHEILDLVAEGDTVAVRGEFSGTQDGESVSFGFADFHRFDDEGEITERWTYTDRDEV